MLNVACLYPQYFEAILAGCKRTEWRIRKRPDSRLEAITPGESIVLLECRTNRAIRARVVLVKRWDRNDHVLYGVRLCRVRLFSARLQHRQGWCRVKRLSDLKPKS